jgi:hypothetical protein
VSDDPHRSAAAKLFNVPEDQVTAEQRARAKTINYATIYGKAGMVERDGTPKRWLSEVPEKCEFCDQSFTGGVFYDAALWITPPGAPDRRIWGLCCQTCFTFEGGKLGTGHGQKYDLETRVKLDG